MLQVYIYSFLITFVFTPLGSLFYERSKKNFEFFSCQLIFASILISFVALLLNFIFSLNQYLNSILLLISSYIIIKNRNVYFGKKYLLFSSISALIITLLITESNTYRPDAGLYHLPFINILNYEKIIFGLSNLHFRFGHISIIQYYSAISNNILFGVNGIVFANAIIASCVIINFLSIFFKKINKKNYDIQFYFIFAIFIFIAYKLNRYSNYGNDAPAHFLLYFLISQLLNLNKKIQLNNITENFLLSVFIFMNKITLSIAILAPMFYLKKDIFKKILTSKKIYFTIFFLFLWIFKNIITSGCIIYPLVQTCYEKLSWSDVDTVKYISKENEAWAKNWPDSKLNFKHKEYAKNFVWLDDWKKNYLPRFSKIIIPYFIFLTILIIILLIFSKRKKEKIAIKIYGILGLLSISIILWFLKFPILRYGQSLIISFFAISFAMLSLQFHITKIIKKTFITFIVLGIFVIFTKNALRIVNNDNDYNNYPWPKYLSTKIDNFPQDLKEKTINGKKFYKAPNGICNYSLPLCSGMEKKFNVKITNSYLFLSRVKDR